jgi:modification methylase
LETQHRIIFQDSGKMNLLSDQSIDLVVTSPPYPMIEMWDEQFKLADPGITRLIESGDGRGAFEAMHIVLDRVWTELYRVMKDGAIACINIGDATRTINNCFQLFPNHSRIQKKLFDLGFNILPFVIWRKQTNAPNKFMGSGMLPAGAYITLEHEYILIFRKGAKRLFATEAQKKNRKQSSYFWEERNTWLSDLWEFKGARQEINGYRQRGRSAAFPFMIPFRLINIYSVFGDTVLDPFLGTGTTTLAAMAAGRNSIGFETESSFSALIKNRIKEEVPVLNRYNRDRLIRHLDFVKIIEAEKNSLKYINSYFGFPVMTGQEKELKLAFVKRASAEEDGRFRVLYHEVPESTCAEKGGLQASFEES